MPAENCVETSKEAVEALFAEAGKCLILVFYLATIFKSFLFLICDTFFCISGNEKRTLADKKNYLAQFKIWCQGKKLAFDDGLLKNLKELEFAFIQYLASYRVKPKSGDTGETLMPKMTTMNKMISMLKSELERLSGKLKSFY